MSYETVDRLMESVCRRLAFLPVTRARKIEGSETARVKPGARTPEPVEDLAGEWSEKYRQEKRDGAGPLELLRVVKGAEQAWLDVAYSPAPSRVRGTLDWKIAVASDQRPSRVVARAYDVSPSYVRTLRQDKRNGRLSKASKCRPRML